MKVLGFKTQRIERLNLQGNFRERLDSPRIFERAKSILRLGILSEPMVRAKDMRVIYGHDRIAGAVRAGKLEVSCKMVDCSDDELREIELTENVQRRHDSVAANAALDKLLELYELQVVEADPLNPPPPLMQGGSRKTARGIARARVSAELGIKPESVHRRELRARKTALAKGRREAIAPITLNLIGMEVNDEFVLETAKVHGLLSRVVNHLTMAQSALTSITTDKGLMPAARLQRLYDDVHAASAVARGHLPVSLCPYCKGLPGIQEHCSACVGCGWLPASAASSVPKELWLEGQHAVVAQNGRHVPLYSVIGEPTAAEVLDEEDPFA